MYNLILLINILRILDEIGMTKSELAEKPSMSVSFLSDLTRDQANPSLRIMESIAKALGPPRLPALLETTDLDKETLDALAGGQFQLSLPEGFTRVSAVLTDFQAFIVRQWDQDNRKHLQTKRRKDARKKGVSRPPLPSSSPPSQTHNHYALLPCCPTLCSPMRLHKKRALRPLFRTSFYPLVSETTNRKADPMSEPDDTFASVKDRAKERLAYDMGPVLLGAVNDPCTAEVLLNADGRGRNGWARACTALAHYTLPRPRPSSKPWPRTWAW